MTLLKGVRMRLISMIVLGVILLLLGYFLGISILYTVGGILLIIGLVLWIAGAMGRGVGGRSHYW
jgi:membrane-bound ClpP family serine protease